MEKNKKRIILWLVLAAWMAIIFSMSAMNGTTSEGLSGGITEKVVKVCVSQYNALPRVKQISILQNVNFAVRKTAHVLEYAVLGVLALLVLLRYRRSIRFQVLVSVLICAAYAASDEMHQIFISGRTPLATDVLIDTGGSVLGIVLLVMLVRRKKRLTMDMKRKNEQIR